jgi:hypothetical protein
MTLTNSRVRAAAEHVHRIIYRFGSFIKEHKGLMLPDILITTLIFLGVMMMWRKGFGTSVPNLEVTTKRGKFGIATNVGRQYFLS